MQVNDVDTVTGTEDILLHLRVPTAGLVAEMHTGFEKLLHRNLGHLILLHKMV